MEPTRQTVLQLELTSDHQSMAGTVRTSDGSRYSFSGWSELFAVLQQLQPEPARITEAQECP